MILRTASNL